jgi:radical SAM superfamily enzyme YgiQ (UPF0313 family)
MNKQFNHTASYSERLGKIRRAGIGVVAGIIVGMDGDDSRVFEQTLRFLQRARLDAVQVNILTPLPGTPLYADMARAGHLTDRDWSHYDYRHVVFRPARMTAAELQAGADWLYAQFYRLDRILCRFARSVFAVGWMPAPKSTRKRRFSRSRGEGRRSGHDFGPMFMRENARLRARTPPTESRRILYNAPPSAPWDGVDGLAWPSLTAGKGNDATGLGRQIKHLPNLLHPGDGLFTGAEP